MKSLIIANWKMNPQSFTEAKQLFDAIGEGIKDVKNMEVVICPPFVFISNLKSQISNLKLGGQDCFWEERGAFTGEISPSMLKDIGCEYVIVGHSERRKYFNETNEMANKKIKAIISAGLKPVLCVGETEEERKQGRAVEILKKQIEKSLIGLAVDQLVNLVVTYEPVWAVGTGNACGIHEAKEMNLFLKKIIKDTPLLYGGSVNSQNAAGYVKEADFSGLLVGGASLIPEEFIKIVENINLS